MVEVFGAGISLIRFVFDRIRQRVFGGTPKTTRGTRVLPRILRSGILLVFVLVVVVVMG